MKTLKYIPVIFVLLWTASTVFSQYYVKLKSDSIALKSDSVKLTLDDHRGISNWQISSDLESWNLLGENSDTLCVRIDSSAYYRSTITEGSCNLVFSDTIFLLEKLTVAGSKQFSVDSLGGVFLLPSGIKVKIPGGAVSEANEIRLDLISADSINTLAAINIADNTSFLSGISLATNASYFKKPIKISIPFQGIDAVSGIPVLYELNRDISSWLFSDKTFIVSPRDKFIEIILKTSDKNVVLKDSTRSLDFYLKYFYFPLPEDPGKTGAFKSESKMDLSFPSPEDPCREGAFRSESLDLSYDNSGGCTAASTKNKIIYYDCGPSQAELYETTEISASCEPQLTISSSGCVKIKKGESATVQLETTIGNIPLEKQKINVYKLGNNIFVPSDLTTHSDGKIPLIIQGLEVGEALVSLKVDFNYFLSTMKAVGAGSSEASSYDNVEVSKAATICVLVYDVPIVNTAFHTNYEDTRAFAGGEVLDDQEEPVTERGVYLDNLKLPNGEGLGAFEAELFDLIPNKTYTLKAYATNLAGTGFGEEIGFVLDVDGNIYRIVTIGTQDWLSENLKTTRYNDGAGIEEINDPIEWGGHFISSTKELEGFYCWYDSLVSNKHIYGGLYNWLAVETKKLCPSGWHVPSANEYLTLIEFVGGIEIGGGKLKEKGTLHWVSPNIGATDEFGLTALPGGYRKGHYFPFYDEDFVGIKEHGAWWTSTLIPDEGVYYVGLSNNYQDAGMGLHTRVTRGASIRCIKD